MKKEKTPKLNHKKKHLIFFIVCLLALAFLLNFLIVMVTPDRGIRAYGTTQVLAVPRSQESIDGSIRVKVTRMRAFDVNELGVGIILLVENQRNRNYLWVEEIVALDLANNQLTTSFDGFLTNVIDVHDIRGVFVCESNFFGILYYVSTQPRGFAFTALFIALLLGGINYVFISQKT